MSDRERPTRTCGPVRARRHWGARPERPLQQPRTAARPTRRPWGCRPRRPPRRLRQVLVALAPPSPGSIRLLPPPPARLPRAPTPGYGLAAAGSARRRGRATKRTSQSTFAVWGSGMRPTAGIGSSVSPYPSTADTTLASRQPRSDPADPRRRSRRTRRHGPAHGHLAPDRQRADPNPRTERSAAVGMPRQAVVERPDGTTSWAGCTGGPSGLGAPVAPSGCAELGGSGKTGLSASTTAGLGRKGRPVLHDLLLLPVARPWLVAVLLVAAGLLWWAGWRLRRTTRRRLTVMALVGAVLVAVAGGANAANVYFSYLPHVGDVVGVGSWRQVPAGTGTTPTHLSAVMQADPHAAGSPPTPTVGHGAVTSIAVADRASGFGSYRAEVYLPPRSQSTG